MNAASILKFFLKRKIIILNKKKILEICEMVGNDVKIGLYKGPIFLNSNNSIQPLKKGLSYHLLIFKPKIGCSTKYIFSKFKKFSKKIPPNKKNLLKLNNKKNEINLLENKFEVDTNAAESEVVLINLLLSKFFIYHN